MSQLNTALQVNFKTRANNPQFSSLLNVFALDGEDLNNKLQELIDNLPKISEIEQLLGAAETVVNTPPTGNGFAAASQQQAAPTADGPVCQHGPMVRRESVRKGGRDQGKRAIDHFCPLPQNDPNKCAPVWGKAF